MLTLRTEADLLRAAARRVRQQRMALNWRQEDLAANSGVAVGTVRTFERSGRIGFANLAKLLSSLRLIDTLVMAFEGRGLAPDQRALGGAGTAGTNLAPQGMAAPASIQEFMATAKVKQRVRLRVRRSGEG